MESTTLASGVISTRIGFGCAGLMREPSARKRQRLLFEAFDRGITHFDVARMYGLGAAEKELGQFARERRDDVVIATKFGIEPAGTPGRFARLQGPPRRLLARFPALRGYVKGRSDVFNQPRSYDAATARVSLQTSLRELQTDYVDLMLIHDPSPTDHVDLEGICSYMEEAREAGLVRAWGVAGEQDPCLRIGRTLPPGSVLQVRDDVIDRFNTISADPDPLITFGLLSNTLDRISRHFNAFQGRRSQWSEALGRDCSSTALAALLLQDGLEVNARGVVLFSTTRPNRLKGLDLIVNAAREADDPTLKEFRRLVSDELAPVT